MQEKHRAKEFKRRCLGLRIHGVTSIRIAMLGLNVPGDAANSFGLLI
jgi:hypothetical protein